MKKLQFILLFIFSTTFVFGLNINNYINNKDCNQIVDKTFFTICYDYNYKSAKAVAYRLDGSLVNENNIKKRQSFRVEKAIARKYRACTKDYTKSGYDRGHLACDAAFDWSLDSLRATYSLANIIPQARKVNRYTWSKVERYARYVAVKLGYVDVINLVKYTTNPKTIGKHKIAVPEGIYKIIYNDDENFKRCFYYKNDNNIDTKKDKLKQHLIGCKNILK